MAWARMDFVDRFQVGASHTMAISVSQAMCDAFIELSGDGIRAAVIGGSLLIKANPAGGTMVICSAPSDLAAKSTLRP